MNESIRELGKWTGVVGIITIITGIIQTIAGLFAFIIGAVPGIIQIILGAKLLNVKKYAGEAALYSIDDPSNQVSNILSDLSSYFKIQGILIIISVVLQIISMFLR